MTLEMLGQVAALGEGLTAHTAHEGLLPTVDTQVHLHTKLMVGTHFISNTQFSVLMITPLP